ncbi:MAG: glutamine-hydrolyzing GMP synthase [Kiritimatiellae bacterium]|nr:glutamine-hydrolyzing GMP synthase [Kiritimatiellia bacterium]
MSAPHEWIAVLDFGSQYTQLIARRVRHLQVYCEILRHDTPFAVLAARRPVGVILSGGPASVLAEGAPGCDPELWRGDLPVLGICYGMQLMARDLGGRVERGDRREYGPARVEVVDPDLLLRGLGREVDVWMSHGDRVAAPPPGFRVLARTENCPVAAMADASGRRFGLQFHPEVVHTPRGLEMLRTFVREVCGARGDWRMRDFIEESIRELRGRIGEHDRVLCALSGGVDSSVTAALLHRAVGTRLQCVYVDTGLMRKGETDQIEAEFGRHLGVNLRVVRAGERFFEALRGVEDPERKRKIIGAVFIQVFRSVAADSGPYRYLAQGTLYPDVVESVSPFGGPTATIKSHHNVGGLPAELGFELIEPLRALFKDEVRELGRLLGLPDALVERWPFPGPGLAVRIVGEVTAERAELLRRADAIVEEEIRRWPGSHEIWQAFAVLLPVRTVGVMGDERTYEHVAAVRAVQSQDGMTADWVRLPAEVLDRIARRIVNEVRGINRVVYDVTSKPPGTIEWE